MSMHIRLEQYRRFLATCWEFIGVEKTLFLAFIAISIFGALTEGLGISLFVPLIDSISQTSSFSGVPLLAQVSKAFAGVSPDIRIPLVAALMFAVVLVRAAVQYLMQFLNVYLPLRIEQRLRYVSFNCLLQMNLAMVYARKSGELQNYIAGYPGRIGQVMVHLGKLCSSAAMLAVYVIFMLVISVGLTFGSLVFIAIVFYLQRHFSSGMPPPWRLGSRAGCRCSMTAWWPMPGACRPASRYGMATANGCCDACSIVMCRED
jgi:ABC-type multidrug transport system fused ATPase/permease subunit